ncbi:hypothetical protein A2671_02435 [Candidatus Kaiserbacteria bacterium RIFCSPHIGHO2_01_FULL_49_13]|uniref:Uncharacterized protein n=1 Tax=Candidatus Kaiserbacteria bacterium RIFCSPHIGHO2_01_FULL_49_13 TaxID=1798477 RepID=A0A1F6CDW3_9BACT|nr:MAG: hypothetical protein A2671_02435 [Candidatus Kaiserbacteria bacterium RIFCSPHIGHO2_01_FULL_49_13]
MDPVRDYKSWFMARTVESVLRKIFTSFNSMNGNALNLQQPVEKNDRNVSVGKFSRLNALGVSYL